MKFTWINGKKDFENCYNVRKKVFIEEQGFAEETEFDDIDGMAHHLLAYDDGRAVATARLFDEGQGFHCGRICILKESRGKNLGLILMSEIDKKAKELGATSLELSAQVRAVPFYERAGYLKYGEEYLDEHCPHIMMKKVLK